MTAWLLKAFQGEQPRIVSNLLPANAAQVAINVRLDDGALTPLRKPVAVSAFDPYPGNYKTIYRWQDTWYGWTTVVNAVPGPVADDRLYVTGDGVPKMIVDGITYDLAVPFPTGALTAVVSGTATDPNIVVSRVYVYTYVTDFGEESEPSPASEAVNWSPGQTVTLTGFAAAPTGRNITKQRIYRTQTGDSGTDLYFIAERTASVDDYVDTVDDAAFGEVLPSRSYNAPPDGLAGLVAMPNGMMAAYDSDNPRDLYFAEPWQPHAWPEVYVLTVDYPIVGLGAIGSSLIVLTEGNPYLVQGAHPSTMQSLKLESNLPCINPRSVVDLGYAIAYASHEGLVMVAATGEAKIITQNLFNRQDWQEFGPITFTAGQLSGRYVASFNSVAADGTPLLGSFMIDASVPFLLRSDVRAEAFFYDVSEGSLYFLKSSGSITRFDPPSGTPLNYLWRSKLALLSQPENFGVIRIDTEDALTDDEVENINDARDDVIAANATALESPLGSELGGAPINTYRLAGDGLEILPPLSKTITVTVYADGKPVAIIGSSNEMKRLPSGFKARRWEVEAFGSRRVQQIAVAGTVAELRTMAVS